MRPDLKKRLSNVQKQWKNAKDVVPESSFERAPDGKYIARLIAMEVKDSAKGNLQIVSTWSIVRGDHAGMTAMMWHGIEDESKMPWLMEYLRKLEVDVDTLDVEDLPDLVEEILKSRPGGRISLRTRDEFQNCRLEQYMDVDEDEDQVEGQDVELSIGSCVSMDWEGDTHVGKVIRLHPKTDQATVLFDETNEEELCNLSDLEVATNESEDKKKEDDDPVEDEDEDEDDEDEDDEDEDDEDEDDEDEDEKAVSRSPVKGDKVTVTYHKKDREGSIVLVNRRTKTCMVKIGTQIKEYPFDSVAIHTDKSSPF